MQDDKMKIDYVVTSPQVDLPINCVDNFTRAHTMFAVKFLLGLDLPFNSGCLAPIPIFVPDGLLLNAGFPTAYMWRTDVAMCLLKVVSGALGVALLECLMAPSGSYPLWLTILAGQTDSGDPFVAHFNAWGGQGAMVTRDGHSTTVFPGTITDTPDKIMETEAPVIFERKALRTDSGGAGTHRGGLGQDVVIRNLSQAPIAATVVSGCYRNGPNGYAGGFSGAPGAICVNDRPPFQRASQLVLEFGDQLSLQYPGGGGYGTLDSCDAECVGRDVTQGLVSA